MCILTWRKDKMRKDPIEFEFGNVDFWGEAKTGEPEEKPREAELINNNQLNPHVATSPKSNPG